MEAECVQLIVVNACSINLKRLQQWLRIVQPVVSLQVHALQSKPLV
jgi:hypothetical protein